MKPAKKKEPPKIIRRRTINPKLRYQLIEAAGRKCAVCGASSTEDDVMLEIDHIIPLSRGGSNMPDNLQVLCRSCNRGKGAMLITSIPRRIKVRQASDSSSASKRKPSPKSNSSSSAPKRKPPARTNGSQAVPKRKPSPKSKCAKPSSSKSRKSQP